MPRYGLGRLLKPDERDRRYPFALALEPPVVKSRIWVPGLTLDQGQTPQCTAFAWKGFLLSSPIRQGWTMDTAGFYAVEQTLDGIPGPPPPYDGSTVRAGAILIAQQGYVSTYLWATTVEEVRAWVLSHGPVVLGTNWYESMFTPDAQGRVSISISGSIAGGHAYLCLGWSEYRQMFRCLNSWGVPWGQRGRFWVRPSDMARLLSEDGEACTAVEQKIIV